MPTHAQLGNRIIILLGILSIVSGCNKSPDNSDSLKIYAKIIENLAIPIPPPPPNEVNDSITPSAPKAIESIKIDTLLGDISNLPAFSSSDLKFHPNNLQSPTIDTEELEGTLGFNIYEKSSQSHSMDIDYSFKFSKVYYTPNLNSALVKVVYGSGVDYQNAGIFYLSRLNGLWEIDSVSYIEMR